MDRRTMPSLSMAFFVVFISMEAISVLALADPTSTNYTMLKPIKKTKQQQVYCEAKNSTCYEKILTCPEECPTRVAKHKVNKGCFIDCSSKCETTCKYRKPKCEGFGSICYDPRFIGGDGVMFYFHGATGGDFALVSDDEFQINAHFIGTRPMGRTRDYTWVQALSVMFGTHNLVIAARRVSQWDDSVDALIVRWDGETVAIPTDGEAQWSSDRVLIERTDDRNNVRVVVNGLVEIYVKVTPIGAAENKAHNYQLPADDSFAHLETQFKFAKLTDLVEGVLGKTYQPNYVSPVKVGVPMPMMGGEDKYRTPSLLSTTCKVCRFQADSSATSYIKEVVEEV
ncbi:hypothetical protein ACHQM5_021896 [Ranunculus cassubicifolius]